MVIFTLLEECQQIRDMETEVPLKPLLSQLKLSEVPQSGFDMVEEEIGDLIGYFIAYWSKNDTNFADYKKQLLSDSKFKPYFDVLLSIVEIQTLDVFKASFFKSMGFSESLDILDEWKPDIKNTRRQLVWIIVLAAILNNRTDIIGFILSRESLNTEKLAFPVNIRNTESTKFFATKMLENGYEIGNNYLPSEWITHEQFKKFLDSRLKYNEKNLIEVEQLFIAHLHEKISSQKRGRC